MLNIREEDNELQYAQEPVVEEKPETEKAAEKEMPAKRRKPEREDTIMNRMAQ